MSPERSRFGEVAELEHRTHDHGGGVASLLHPNGSIVATGDWPLSNVFAVAVYALHLQERR